MYITGPGPHAIIASRFALTLTPNSASQIGLTNVFELPTGLQCSNSWHLCQIKLVNTGNIALCWFVIGTTEVHHPKKFFCQNSRISDLHKCVASLISISISETAITLYTLNCLLAIQVHTSATYLPTLCRKSDIDPSCWISKHLTELSVCSENCRLLLSCSSITYNFKVKTDLFIVRVHVNPLK